MIDFLRWKYLNMRAGLSTSTARIFTFQEAQGYADENGLLFMETSAKTAMNVNDIFLAIGKKLCAYWTFIIRT